MDNTPELATLKAERARAEAQRDLARAQLEQLQAELVLAKAKINPLVGDKASIEAETTLQTLRKAQAEARTAAVNAEVAGTKAQLGSVTGTTLTGAVTAQQGAGGLEASVLVAKAIGDAVVQIKEKLPALAEKRRFILFTGSQRPDFAEWGLFQIRRIRVLQAYERATMLQQRTEEEAQNSGIAIIASGEVAREIAAAATTAAGAVLDIASKLGSYFQSDYTVSSVALAGVDADLVAVSLAGLLPDAWYPARWPLTLSDNPAIVLLGEVLEQRDASKAKRKAVEANRRVADTAAAQEGDAARKVRLQNLSARFAEAIEAYDVGDKAFDALLDSLATTDTNGMLRITRVIEQKAVLDGLAQGDVAVLLQLGGAAGTTYTKKSLWTFLGGMPFFISGGAIVSFLAIGGDGAVKAGGQIPLHSGFLKIRKIPGWITRGHA